MVLGSPLALKSQSILSLEKLDIYNLTMIEKVIFEVIFLFQTRRVFQHSFPESGTTHGGSSSQTVDYTDGQ